MKTNLLMLGANQVTNDVRGRSVPPTVAEPLLALWEDALHNASGIVRTTILASVLRKKRFVELVSRGSHFAQPILAERLLKLQISWRTSERSAHVF